MDLNKIFDLKKKSEVSKYLKKVWKKSGFKIIEENWKKPWGGYFKFSEKNIEKFIEQFFGKDFKLDKKHKKMKLDPKILVVEKNQRLSWQYHYRRAEYWKVISGEVEVIVSKSDKIPENGKVYRTGDLIILEKEIRHRLIGLDNWGMVSEIWVHTDSSNPSNEEDIVRISDDYGR